MPATVIVGLQWGDEGKGKTTDFLAEQVAMVVRYQGGDNAGHTVQSGSEVFKLHLVPSGVLYPHITSVIGNGVVVNPATLIDELDKLTARGIDVSRVRVSRAALQVSRAAARPRAGPAPDRQSVKRQRPGESRGVSRWARSPLTSPRPCPRGIGSRPRGRSRSARRCRRPRSASAAAS